MNTWPQAYCTLSFTRVCTRWVNFEIYYDNNLNHSPHMYSHTFLILAAIESDQESTSILSTINNIVKQKDFLFCLSQCKIWNVTKNKASSNCASPTRLLWVYNSRWVVYFSELICLLLNRLKYFYGTLLMILHFT